MPNYIQSQMPDVLPSVMQIGVLQVQVLLPGVRSLKEKRGIIKGILQRIQNRFQVATAEVGHQDVWDLAGFGFAAVGTDVAFLQSRLQKVVNFIESSGLVEVLDFHVDILS
ncbi:MAG: DUF503 domain-containing protein [Magnetococcus sp. DMHC-6]